MQSIVSYPERGNYGKNSYRGNCSGEIIKDLIKVFKPKEISDFMSGSGTTRDVAREMNIEGHFYDLNGNFEGGQFDIMSCDIPLRSEMIFWHPPYWNIIKFAGSQYEANDAQLSADLSKEQTWEEFVREMNYACMKQFTSLEKGGRMCVLMGDIKKKGKLYSMLAEIAKPGTLEQIVIKAQHNCVSDRRTYNGSFIPIVHEYLMIVKRENGLQIPVLFTTQRACDMRDMMCCTWRDLLIEVLKELGKDASLEEIYSKVDGHKKTQKNPHWQEKVRQTLRDARYFTPTSRGVYALAA